MSRNIAHELAAVHPQMLKVDSEGLRKKLGERVERALAIAGVTKQEAAFQMGYSDPGVVSRWCSAVERPLLDKLFLIVGFENAWLLALAEHNPNAEVTMHIAIKRTA